MIKSNGMMDALVCWVDYMQIIDYIAFQLLGFVCRVDYMQINTLHLISLLLLNLSFISIKMIKDALLSVSSHGKTIFS
jgi:hypothetical protein